MMPLTNVRTILEAALIVAFIAVVGVLNFQKYSLKSELQETKIQLVKSQALNEQYQVSVEKQNAAVEGLMKAANDNKAKYDVEIKRVQKEAAKAKADAATILALKKPDNLNSCDAAKELIIKELIDAK